LTRPPLEGSGEWTHQYGDAANTANSGETLSGTRSTNDLTVQWVGRPGGDFGIDRNPRMPAPVAANGRLFVTTCYDQRKLLEGGVAGRWDVVSPDGEYIERLAVTVPDVDGTQDALFFMDGQGFLLIRNFDQATESMTAGFGGDGEASEDDGDSEPLEVVYYRMP
jgi:hypothetical protein